MKRTAAALTILLAACTPRPPSTLRPPVRPATEIRASKEEAWDALLRVWQANTAELGDITRTDYEAGLLQATLLLEGSRFSSSQIREWGECSAGGGLGIDPMRADWTVVVSGGGEASRIRASLHFVQPAWDCRSTGVREAQLEAMVKETAESIAVDSPPRSGRSIR